VGLVLCVPGILLTVAAVLLQRRRPLPRPHEDAIPSTS